LKYQNGFGIFKAMKINKQISGYFSAMGRIGGKSKSPAKLAAIAKNAKLGGWPKGRPRKANKT
jgi:hypothetical protein